MRTRTRLGVLVAVLGLSAAGAVGAMAMGNDGTSASAPGVLSSAGPPPPPAPPPSSTVAPATSPTSTRPGDSAATSTSRSGGAPSSPTVVAPRATTSTTRAGGSRTTTAASPPPATPTSTPPATAPPVATTVPAGNTAADALDALNRDRVAQGLPALRTRSDLQAKAQAWADRSARDGTFFHSNLSDGVAPCATGLGENMAAQSSVAGAEKLLMSDPPHRANIMGRWDWVGVGVARTANGLIVVQDFITGCV